MSEQNMGMPVNDIDDSFERVFQLVQKLNTPWSLVEMVAKRYPYGEKFATNYQQDEDVAQAISRIKQEGENFKMSKRHGETVEHYIEVWIPTIIGNLTEDVKVRFHEVIHN